MKNWLMESNHWKHLAACFVIALFLGASAGLAAGVAAEWKDKQWGGKFDWSDIVADLVGVALAVGIRHALGLRIL